MAVNQEIFAPNEKTEKEKAQSAAIFYKAWKAAEADVRYAVRKAEWKKKYG